LFIPVTILNFQELHTAAQGLRVKVIATQSTPICLRGGKPSTCHAVHLALTWFFSCDLFEWEACMDCS